MIHDDTAQFVPSPVKEVAPSHSVLACADANARVEFVHVLTLQAEEFRKNCGFFICSTTFLWTMPVKPERWFLYEWEVSLSVNLNLRIRNR
jgi:hypothetical protein